MAGIGKAFATREPDRGGRTFATHADARLGSSRASRVTFGVRAAVQAAASLPFFSSSERFASASASAPDFTSTVDPTST